MSPPPEKPGNLLAIRLHPGAGRERVVGRHGEAIKIEVSAPPLEGKANQALLKFLSRRLGLPRRSLWIVQGEKSKDKLIEIEGMPLEQAERLLLD